MSCVLGMCFDKILYEILYKNFLFVKKVSKSKSGQSLDGWPKLNAPQFPMSQEKNRYDDNKNAFYNMDITFFIQNNANLHLSKTFTADQREVFSQFFLPKAFLFCK